MTRAHLWVSRYSCGRLPWLGFVPDDVAAAPTAAAARLGEQLGVDLGELAGEGRREQTRTDHLWAVMAYRGLAGRRRAVVEGAG